MLFCTFYQYLYFYSLLYIANFFYTFNLTHLFNMYDAECIFNRRINFRNNSFVTRTWFSNSNFSILYIYFYILYYYIFLKSRYFALLFNGRIKLNKNVDRMKISNLNIYYITLSICIIITVNRLLIIDKKEAS